ncbi:MAG: hypothetical protein A2V65_03460 [Deltaproteobacteria bacterium RBG_13_49_15]|nr:MAG: hypothetical protein A2V65_03460 [Deltaproteobacteria bacterium RBG_13_49_15]
MSNIKILPEILSNKIAAGEVIERPASVVKELLENALDAESSRLLIEVKNGGKSLIRVSDDGAGMEHDDALLSLERYATSKIFLDKDLFSIRTLGFRGEALPSIAAVSRMILSTNDDPNRPGTEILVEGGKIKQVNLTGAPRGTMVTVKDLFFNVPARRKYMKGDRTEMGHIVDTLDRIALGRPGIVFDLTADNRSVKRYSATDQPSLRAVDILGKTVTDKMLEIRLKNGDLSVRGWILSPDEARSTTRGIYIYVNDRFVRDRVVLHALLEGYKGALVKGVFPLAILMIHLPPDQVDVNVHPTKNEVRFLKQRDVHDAISAEVSRVLERSRRFRWTPVRKTESEIGSVAEPVSTFIREEKYDPLPEDRVLPHDLNSMEQRPLWKSHPLEPLRVIGQLRNTYILCETKEGLLLIDQHAAHERIIYERMKKMEESGEKSGQRLLIPETIDLGYREARVLERLISPLSGFQLEIEPFGENTFVIKTVPSILTGVNPVHLISEMTGKAAETGFADTVEAAIDHCLSVMACHGAIRAHQMLSPEQMEVLINDLMECVNPAHCPHGRPVFIEWNILSLEKAFQRKI